MKALLASVGQGVVLQVSAKGMRRQARAGGRSGRRARGMPKGTSSRALLPPRLLTDLQRAVYVPEMVWDDAASSALKGKSMLTSPGAMPKIATKHVHRRSCANNSALPVQLVCKTASDRAYLAPAREARRRERCRRKPPENSPASRPRWAPTASAVAWKLVWAPRRTPLHPLPCCATAAQRPSAPTGERDRDQPGALRYATRPASAAQRGRTIIRRAKCLGRDKIGRGILAGRLGDRPTRRLARQSPIWSPVVRTHVISMRK